MEPLDHDTRQSIHREVNWYWHFRDRKLHRAEIEKVSFHLDALIALLEPTPNLVARYRKAVSKQDGAEEAKRKRGRPPDPRTYNSSVSLETLTVLHDRQEQLGGTEISEIVGALCDLQRYVNLGPAPKGKRGPNSLPLWKSRAIELLIEQWKTKESSLGVEFDEHTNPKSALAKWLANEATLIDPLVFPDKARHDRSTEEKITNSNLKTVLVDLRKRNFPSPDRNWS